MLDRELSHMEELAYRERLSDGIIDLFAGVSLLWIASMWLWVQDLAAISGVFPAVFIAPAMAIRKQVLESRGGYVKFSAERRKTERSSIRGLLAMGVITLLAGVAGVALVASGGDLSVVDWIMPGLLAFLLAIPAFALAGMLGIWRFAAYGAVLVTAGMIAASTDSNPGAPLFAAGAVTAVTGVWLLLRYLRRHPRPA